jgi:hypothetical protein
MNGQYVGGQGPRWFENLIRVDPPYQWLIEGKVPHWLPEDEANLRRRVQRLAAKAKP